MNEDDLKKQLWPIVDILASLETECMIGVKLEKDGKISSEERQRRVEEAHGIAFNKLAQYWIVSQSQIEQALTADGAQHKQWYLWRIAEALGIHMDIDADKGIAP